MKSGIVDKIYRNIKNHKESVILFTLSFLIILGFNIVLPIDEIPFDAGHYDELSSCFVSSGKFDLRNYTKSLRGVIFPLLLFVFKKISAFIANDIFFFGGGWNLLIATLVASIITILPKFFEVFVNKKFNILQKILPLIFILIFWNGLVRYPLSDLVAVAFLILGMYTMLVSYQNQGAKQLVYAFLSGIFMYATYNTRTIYLFPIAVFIPMIAIFNWKVKQMRCAFSIVGVLLGIFGLGCIQGYVNLCNMNRFSFKVITDNLFGFQLAQGMRYSQFKGYIGEIGKESQYPDPGVMFIDRMGAYIYEKENLEALGNISVFAYIRIFLKYPFDFIGIYARHFINMLNPIWGEIYKQNLCKPKMHLSFLNYIIVFCSGKYLFQTKPLIQKRNRSNLLCIIMILLPCLFILPGAVELRFFFPMYLILYGIFIYLIDFRNLLFDMKIHWMMNLIVFLAIFFVLCAVWGCTYANTGASVVFSVF